ncbi:uncharacterized protein BP5553_09719 [Venustampulla echinocandica]|uniref:GPI anchored serine-rich protein n=1 Tax=Venustampulla echinocandica TaxID=2656787 RepID=A0A370TBT1_9HELO|nr:uncharacterized protein BP5553_09719 [Venustampulla echinocandica]RDL31510.1 hypothetical protein BP5553_09719 [Venustampulla echinocandica]
MKASIISVVAAAAAVNAHGGNSTIPTGTISTIYSTSVYTITSCAPTVTNCPVGKVTSEVYSTTTFCPATTPAVATSVPAGPSISTEYQTHVYTITSCAPTVTNCPVGKVTSTVETVTKVHPTGKPSGVIPPPAGKPECPAVTSYVTVTVPATPAGQKPATSVGAVCPGGANCPPAATGVAPPANTAVVCPGGASCPPANTAVVVCPGGANCPKPVPSAAPTGGKSYNTTTTVPFTSGASAQKAGGLLMAVGLAAAYLL